MPKFGEYFKKTIFSLKGLFNIAKSIGKVAVIVVVAYLFIKNDIFVLIDVNLNISEYNVFKTLGLLFEDFCVRDLTIYSSMFEGQVKHYRDGNGNECDAVITTNNNNWAAIEIKLGGYELEQEGIKTLFTLFKT